jgi:hypothetical protein
MRVVCKPYTKSLRLCTTWEWVKGSWIATKGGEVACGKCKMQPAELDKELCAGCLNEGLGDAN